MISIVPLCIFLLLQPALLHIAGPAGLSTRIVSGAHALVVGVASLAVLMGHSSMTWDQIRSVSFGYLISDILMIIGDRSIRSAEMLAHHMIFIWLLCSPIDETLGLYGLVSELSLLPLHVGWAMIRYKVQKGKIIVGAITVLAFLIRTIAFIYMTVQARSILMGVITIMNIRWLAKLVATAVSAISGNTAVVSD
jgi:hypothetical protein